MTRRKAIEAAMDITPQDVSKRNPEGTWGSWIATKQAMVAERAYYLGRIAGLREAATMTIRHNGGWTPMVGMVQRKARGLAKELKQC